MSDTGLITGLSCIDTYDIFNIRLEHKELLIKKIHSSWSSKEIIMKSRENAEKNE